MKKILLVIMSVLVMAIMAGCGGDPIVGDWMYKGKSLWDGSEILFVFHIEKLDNGNYIIKPEHLSYRHDYANSLVASENDMLGKDAILNSKEAFVPSREIFGYTYYKWNGTPVKFGRKYVYSSSKGDVINNAKKEDIPIKDGKLVLNYGGKAATYEKADKAKIDKAMSDWKESLKKEVGKEFTFNKAYVDPKTVKGQIAKVVIVENGKEEVFAEK